MLQAFFRRPPIFTRHVHHPNGYARVGQGLGIMAGETGLTKGWVKLMQRFGFPEFDVWGDGGQKVCKKVSFF